MAAPSTDAKRDRQLRYALVFVGLLTLAYAVVIAQQILLWVWLATTLAVLYLVWRFVRAHERLAAAATSIAAESASAELATEPNRTERVDDGSASADEE